MADINTAIDSELRPEPDKPVRLNRKTVLTVGATGVAVLFLGLNLGLRGFSKGTETPTRPINENLLVMPGPATAIPNLTYADVTQPKIPDPVSPKAESLPDPEPQRQSSPPRSSEPSEEQLTAWSSPLFPPSTQTLRQVQEQEPTGNALDSALAKLADIRLPTPQDLFPGNQPSDAERNEAFLKASTDGDVYLQQVLQGPMSPYEIKAGSIIPAALITGLNSDLPGQIVGQVTEPVYDTLAGQHLLIPQGTKIVGRYNADIGYGQNRLQIVWDRLIMPNGNSIGLDSMVGTDKTGAAGLEDQVDYHIPGLVGAVLLSSIIGVGANLATDSSANGSFIDDLGDTAAQQAASVGSGIISRQLDIQPAITIRPGFRLNILVGKDMIFPEPYR